MTKLISLISALVLLLSAKYIPTTSVGIIGGADGPTNIYISTSTTPTKIITFDADISTGYEWSAFILGGDSVIIDEANSCYVENTSKCLECGESDYHYFTLRAVKPGETLVRFSYCRAGEAEPSEIKLILATVNSDMSIITQDISSASAITGLVTSVNPNLFSASVATAEGTEFIMQFDQFTQLPSDGERITVYTNGTAASYSLPQIANAIAWNTVASCAGRYLNINPQSGIQVYVWQMAEGYYRCGIISSTDSTATEEEILALQFASLSVEETKEVLCALGIDKSEISIIGISQPYSSYLYEINDEYRIKVESLFR